MATFPTFRPGQNALRADDMNFLVGQVRELDNQAQIKVRNAKDKPGGPLGVRRAEILAERADYLECVAPGATAGTFLVAKPYLLRVTPFHNKSRDQIDYLYDDVNHRTATKVEEPAEEGEDPKETTEVQEVIPRYVAGDIIYAATKVWGGAGTLGRDIPIEGFESVTVYVGSIDLNVDGRMWARV